MNRAMQRFVIFNPGALLCLSLLMPAAQRFKSCLPSTVKPTEVVTLRTVTTTNTVEKITVEQKLTELKARCKNGKLVDASGKEIHFFRMTGCWGNPPPDYQEILEKQNNELEKLRKRYLVIEITCNPDGIKIQ